MVEAFLIVLAILVAFGSIAVGRSVRAGWDVVIEVEDVAGVVVILDRGEPWHLAGAVRAPHSFRALVGEVVDVHAAGVGFDGLVAEATQVVALGRLADRDGRLRPSADYLVACRPYLGEVVSAGGEILHASDAQNPDLFWGLRGGGGNFGIVTEFEFRLHPVSAAALVADLFYRPADAPQALRRWRDLIPGAPPRATLTRLGRRLRRRT